ncbi:MAG: transposase [Bacteroidota bacterium]
MKSSKKNVAGACGFSRTIKWGKQGGKQRYKCKNCGILFTGSNPVTKYRNSQVWFEKWVSERQTYRYLSLESHKSVSTLQRLFRHYLSHPPTYLIRSRDQVHLIIDGTYFTNDLCLVLYRDNDIKYTQLYRFSDGEHYGEIKEDLDNLALLGIGIASVTCDGKRSIIKAVREVYPDVVLQRCVVHVHRMGNIWLRKRPKTQASISLKHILNLLPKVRTHNDRRAWEKQFQAWYLQHES